MNNWQEVKLGSVCKIIGGYSFKSKDFTNKGIAVVKIKNLKDKNVSLEDTDYVDPSFLKINKKFHILDNDILVALTGSHITLPASAVGRVVKSRHKNSLLLNQRVGKFKVNDELCDHDFIYYVASSDTFFEQVGLRSRGAANQANISGGDIESIKIKLPPLSTQKKIAKILSHYDDLMKNNLKVIKLLEESARLTYEEWFLRFRIDDEKLKIDSKTGLPFEWEKKKIGDVCDVSSSKRIFLSDYVDEGIPFYRGKEITIKSQNKSVTNDLYITQKKFEEINNSFGSPSVNDILISAVGTLGSIYLVKQSDGEFYFKDGNLLWLKSFNEDNNLIVYYALKSERLQANLSGIAIGSSQKALTIQALRLVEIPFPNKDIEVRFNQKIRPIIYEIENLINQNKFLKEARDVLLPRLMTGMIDVEDMEIAV